LTVVPAEPLDRWTAPDLSGRVAVVTGASRGVGRGVAEVLGDCGATVYLAGRSVDEPATPGRAGTLTEVADVITRGGGIAIVARCDLTDDGDVDALMARIEREHGYLDVLVNNAVGWDDTGAPAFLMQPPWLAPRTWWASNFEVGVRSHWLVTNAAAKLLTRRGGGLVVFTSERQPGLPGMQELVLDLRGTTVARMAHLYSLHFRPHRVSSILLYPGFSRTDAIERSFADDNDYFSDWTAEEFSARTASIHYAGRAVAMLAADPALLERSGTIVTSHDAAVAYGFTDTNGTQPDPD
jgi:NAD(P)-dependent dehydrogenase (short-subunit alcohol dehydrogenase family)